MAQNIFGRDINEVYAEEQGKNVVLKELSRQGFSPEEIKQIAISSLSDPIVYREAESAPKPEKKIARAKRTEAKAKTETTPVPATPEQKVKIETNSGNNSWNPLLAFLAGAGSYRFADNLVKVVRNNKLNKDLVKQIEALRGQENSLRSLLDQKEYTKRVLDGVKTSNTKGIPGITDAYMEGKGLNRVAGDLQKYVGDGKVMKDLLKQHKNLDAVYKNIADPNSAKIKGDFLNKLNNAIANLEAGKVDDSFLGSAKRILGGTLGLGKFPESASTAGISHSRGQGQALEQILEQARNKNASKSLIKNITRMLGKAM